MAQFIISAFADEAASNLAGQIAALKRNGIRYLEPRSIEGDLTKKTDEELWEIRRGLDEAGISVSSYGSPIGKYDITKDFERYLERFQRALSVCKILGTSRMRMFSFYVSQADLKAHRTEVLRRLGILCALAEREGIALCHENETDIYGQNPEQVADLLHSLSGLRGVFDAANYVMNDQDPIKGIEATMLRLEYLHIKDALQAEKMIVPVGEGDGCYAEVLRRVDRALDGRVFLTVEPHLHVFEAYGKIDRHELKTKFSFSSPDEAFDCAVEHLKALLTSLGFAEDDNKIWKKQEQAC